MKSTLIAIRNGYVLRQFNPQNYIVGVRGKTDDDYDVIMEFDDREDAENCFDELADKAERRGTYRIERFYFDTPVSDIMSTNMNLAQVQRLCNLPCNYSVTSKAGTKYDPGQWFDGYFKNKEEGQ